MNLSVNNKFDDLDEMDEINLPIRNAKIARKRKGIKTLVKQKGSQEIERTVNPFNEEDYPFTYQASQHEKQWMLDALREFHEQKWFDDILTMVKGGKEASVYLCKAAPELPQELLAAKVYRPRRFRNLKKDHLYREGRTQVDADGKVILDDRSHHAMQKKTTYGLELLHSSWLGHEFTTMKLLFEAGVDVPKPFASGDNAILMEYVGDVNTAAPTLNTVSLGASEARSLFQRTIHNIELMLRCNRIHADLSAYNILYWDGDIRIIDFPQAIDPDVNHNAYRIFQRDVMRVCEYFAKQGVRSDHDGLAQKLWTQKGRETIAEVHPLYLDPEKPEDRVIWNQQRK